MTTRFSPDAILLAAGLGTRMMPLSATRPKPLLEIFGTSLIERVIENFQREDINNFVVNAHHHADQVETAVRLFATKHAGASFGVSREDEELLNSGGGAKKALRLTQSDPVLVANTDAFWQGSDKPLARMGAHFNAAREGQSDAVVLLCAHPAKSLGFRRSHDFCLNPRGRITLDSGVPVIYAGVALLPRKAFARTPNTAFSLNMIFERALEKNALFGVLLEADWYHVGDPEALAEAEARLGHLA
jgi:N-acetyl-alpha-D-muramate 1-phosphate uridylyltransferase